MKSITLADNFHFCSHFSRSLFDAVRCYAIKVAVRRASCSIWVHVVQADCRLMEYFAVATIKVIILTGCEIFDMVFDWIMEYCRFHLCDVNSNMQSNMQCQQSTNRSIKQAKCHIPHVYLSSKCSKILRKYLVRCTLLARLFPVGVGYSAKKYWRTHAQHTHTHSQLSLDNSIQNLFQRKRGKEKNLRQ